jgi:hypothetical protein
VVADPVVELAREFLDRPLECRVVECRDFTALLADKVVVVMISVRQRRLISRRIGTHVKALDEAHPGQ